MGAWERVFRMTDTTCFEGPFSNCDMAYLCESYDPVSLVRCLSSVYFFSSCVSFRLVCECPCILFRCQCSFVFLFSLHSTLLLRHAQSSTCPFFLGWYLGFGYGLHHGNSNPFLFLFLYGVSSSPDNVRHVTLAELCNNWHPNQLALRNMTYRSPPLSKSTRSKHLTRTFLPAIITNLIVQYVTGIHKTTS